MVKKFNPKSLGKKAIEISTVEDAELGQISYGDLTIGETFDVIKIESLQERGLQILFLMLQKACPSLTLDDVRAFPQGKASRIMGVLGEIWKKQISGVENKE